MANDTADDVTAPKPLVVNGVNGHASAHPLGAAARPGTARAAELTVVIPCYNERNTVLDVIRMVGELPVDKEIIVVDNCSTDGTRDLLIEACNGVPDPSLQPTIEGQRILRGDRFLLILQPKNFRKGTSVRTGVALARGTYVCCQDADLEYEPADIVRLLEHATRTRSAAVFGSRLSETKLERPTTPKKAVFHAARVGLTHVFRALYASRITDVATCYKLMRTDVAKSLGMEASGFELDFEIPAKLRKRQIVIDELPIAYHPRTHADGKKIGWRDGVAALYTMAKHRLP
ncbi:MAG: glycosyltransferase family 2 protein [Polyangiaceae bacterium]